MANFKVKLEGLKELEAALGQLPKATGRNVLRRVLKEAGEPIAQAARAKAPRETGNLIESIDVGTRLTRRQTGQHKKQSTVEMHVGSGPNPQSITQEFGTFKEPAQPFMRPAWDSQKRAALDIIYNLLWPEIERAATRHANKLARKAAKG